MNWGNSVPKPGKFDAPLVNMEGKPLSPTDFEGRYSLTVGLVLADAVLTRKAGTALGQMAAFTLAQRLYQAGRGTPLPIEDLERLGVDDGDVWTQLGDDLARYAAQQPNLLVVGQLQVWLDETRRSIIDPNDREFDPPDPKSVM
jgi:hypothetical protein